MLLSLCSIASHAYDFEVDGLYYNLISASDKTCELVGGNDNLTQITIPNAITVRNQNLSVVSMSSSAFKNKTNAVSVSFRESAITEIPSNAFYACTQLSSVVLSSKIATISSAAFYNCPIQKLTIPSNVDKVGDNALNSVKELIIEDSNTALNIVGTTPAIEKLYLGRDVTSAIVQSSSLGKVQIGPKVTTLPANFFRNCTKLNVAEIPSNVKTIGNYCFYGCSLIKKVTISNSESIGLYAFANCNNLRMADINAETIQKNCFNNSEKLSWISLGANVKSIEASAFEKTAISNIGIKATTPPAASVSTFSSISKVNTTIYVPQGTISLYQKAEGWKEFLFIEEGQLPEYVSPVPESTVEPIPGGQNDVLIISGNLTGATIKSINANSSIKKLDLSNAKIVLDNKNAYYTSGQRVERIHWDDVDVVRGAPYYSYNYYTAPENASGSEYERDSRGKIINIINTFFCCDLTNAFLNSSLTEIKLPSSLTKLGENAISGNSLSDLYVYGLTPPEATVKSFGNTRTSCVLHVPAGTKSKYASANGWKAFTNIVEESQENYISTQPTNNSPVVKLAYTDSKATYQWYKKSKEKGTEMDCTDAFSSQGWEKDGQNWISSNHASDSKATLSMDHSFKKGDILSFAWKVMSENPFDQLQCRMGDEVIIAKSGIDSGTCSYTFAKDISGTLNFYYIKDNSVDENEDKAIISNVKITSKTSFEIPVTSAIEGEITSTLNRKSCKNGDKVWCVVTLGDNHQLVSDTIDISYTTITDISFKSQETTMETGEVKSIQPTLVPSNAFNDEFLWESSNNQIAKVDATGTVTALAVGNATITAHTKDGSNLAASYTINVKQGNYIKRQPTKDNMSVELAFEDKEAKYQWYNISAYKIYSDSICDYEKDITELFYTSGSPAGGDGWQYMDGKWNCEITDLDDISSGAIGYYNSLFCKLKDNAFIPNDTLYVDCQLSGRANIYSDNGAYWTKVQSGQYTFEYRQMVSNSSDYVFMNINMYCPKNEYGTCELSNLIIKGKRPYIENESTPIAGESSPTLNKENGLNSVFCEITLSNGRKIISDTVMISDVIAPEFIKLSTEKLNIKLGDKASITAIVNPLNSTDTSVKWESSNSDIATVSQNGEITAISAGTSIISAKTSNGIIASCEVKVIDPNVHEYVDLGLPSGLLWATTDIGALTPEDEGLEFVWGGTSVDTKWADIKDIVLGYDEISDTEYDVAKVQWGNGWRLPTAEEARELMKYCTPKGSNTQKIDGYSNSDFEYTGPNGNSIFFYHVFHEVRNTFYMTGTLARRDHEKNYWMNIGYHSVYGNDGGSCGCSDGHRVRPVIEAKNTSVKNIEQDTPQIYNVYNLNGSLTLKTNEKSKLRSLPKGIYIVNGKKMIVK